MIEIAQMKKIDVKPAFRLAADYADCADAKPVKILNDLISRG